MARMILQMSLRENCVSTLPHREKTPESPTMQSWGKSGRGRGLRSYLAVKAIVVELWV
jgi:hypothetical protein